MRRRYIWHNGAFVDITDMPRPKRIGPYIIRDQMETCIHPATGEMMDSKSAFRAVTREHGLVEVGNDAPTSPPPLLEDLKGDVAQAIEMLEQGYEPPPIEAVDSLPGVESTRIYG